MKAEDLFSSVVNRVSKEVKSLQVKGRGIERRKKLEERRIKLYDTYLAKSLMKTYKNFPDISRLPPYLQELLDVWIGIDKLKLSLGRIKGSLRALEGIRDDILFKIQRARSPEELYKLRKQYLARIYEVLEGIDKDLHRVSLARRELRRIPPIDQKLPIVVIAGFPNAGKSSLLKALTGSDPEIAPYPFTTKRLLLGCFSDGYRDIQVVDTPGLLDRPVERMKPEEREAVLSMKHFADLILFLYDPFQEETKQKELYQYLRRSLEKPFLALVGKADLLEDPEAERRRFDAELSVSPLTGSGVEDLRNLIIKKMEGIKW